MRPFHITTRLTVTFVEIGVRQCLAVLHAAVDAEAAVTAYAASVAVKMTESWVRIEVILSVWIRLCNSPMLRCSEAGF